MSHVENFFSRILKSIPVIATKIGTVLVFLFTIGLVGGYYIATTGTTPTLFLIPLAAMIIMWYKLDEGVFVLILLTILVLFFPEFVDGIISSIL